MTFSEITLLTTAGFAAGVLNAIAGGGTIFTFSALLAVGVPPVAANATSATAVVLGSVASAVAYRREIAAAFRKLLPLCVISMLGGGIGAALLLWSGDRTFRALVPWLLLFATLLFAGARQLQKVVQARAALKANATQTDLALPAQGLVSIYGGYFGAGMGVMMLASLSLSRDSDYHAVNAAKNLLSIVLQAVAAVVFLMSGIVDLKLSLLIAVASIVGGWSGVVVARRVPEAVVRGAVIVSGLTLSLWYFVT
ncbi:sulfite exporter TauE/SafE family protein [Bradyrhizobium sp. 2TAF24]|uniref:sulfite exporter TauE/SafE family protein n=1 Tax=Bradyrhizobium sp. 2TAF24 TaxID=3233011 RepID=UPI003F90B638